MIEIICDSDNDNKSKDGSKGNTVIRTPKNIKQIGDVSSDKKIYIEDYAFSYINSLAYGLDNSEQSGVLLGEYQKNDSEKCLFIKGVVKAKNPDVHSEGIIFNENVWSGIYKDIEKYFPNLEVVGWYAAVSGLTQQKMEYLKKLHKDNFTGGLKTLYLVDTHEKIENFYLYEGGKLKKQSGYVCYYERNYEMQEYMLEKRGRRSVESKEKDKVMQSIREIINNKEQLQHQRKNMIFMYSIGSVLAVVVLVIGINLINSYEKMQNFDNSLSTIVKQISDISDKDDNAKDAASSEIVPVNKLSGEVYPTQSQEEQSTQSMENNSVQDNTQESQMEGSTIYTDGAAIENETGYVQLTESDSVQASQYKETEGTQAVSQSVIQNSQADNTADVLKDNTVPSYTTYVVKKGDTIMSICQNYYGTVKKYDEVAALNNLDDVNKLYIGQEIKLP